MSKRRVFDIDFPGDTPEPEAEPAVPAGTDAPRRSPMAAAISENADALRDRAEAERRIRAENDKLAHEHVRLKKAGLITDLIPLDAIRMDKLTRDRRPGADPELDELKESIRAVGLSNPIRVEPAGEGVYELVQGFRRLSAFKALHEETGEDRFAAIPAGIVAHGETLEGLYRRMVDENLVRKDISFAEMAALALNYVRDPEIACDRLDDAIQALYGSSGRQKRSYIRRFAALLQAIGSRLKFPEAIPRALGLDLEKRIGEDPAFGTRLASHLGAQLAATPEREVEVLRDFLARHGAKPKGRATASGGAKTTLRCALPQGGTVRVAARDGKVELAAERDFSGVDPRRLEAAVAAFMQALSDD